MEWGDENETGTRASSDAMYSRSPTEEGAVGHGHEMLDARAFICALEVKLRVKSESRFLP